MFVTDGFFKRVFLCLALCYALLAFMFLLYWLFVPHADCASQIGPAISYALGALFMGAVIPDNDC
jgi:apolipoprotein N-acyltransferase